jgi:hypothetical protein
VSLFDEQHYTPQELASRWGLSDETVRRLVVDEPGVIRLGKESRRVGRKLTRAYVTYRIPASVAARLHQKLTRR